jgi:uncharacterized damage-inducible protein DinB
MKEYFLKLYQYNAWANKRVLGAMKQQEVTDEKVLTLMTHVLAAQFIWLARIKGEEKPKYRLWDTLPLEQLESMAEEIGKKWLEYVESGDYTDRELSYNNYVGKAFVSKVEHIMMHLVNHSTYHRAQVAFVMRQKGFEPINTDFISYDRVITGQLKD